LLEKEQPKLDKITKELAEKISDKLPIIYSEENFEGVAVRYRQQINENSKTFEVTPGDRMSAFSFSGKFSNKNFAKWSAVAKLVYMAVEFAINDLKLKPAEKENTSEIED
jgi:hypothetical protein